MELALARSRRARSSPRPSQHSTAPMPPKDTRSAWEDALRSDEFAQRARQRQQREEASDAADMHARSDSDYDEGGEDDEEDEEQAIADAVAAVEAAKQRVRMRSWHCPCMPTCSISNLMISDAIRRSERRLRPL